MARNHKRNPSRKGKQRGRPRFSIRDWPNSPPPALGTVRRWLHQAEAEGLIERRGVQRTGKPGRPAHLWAIAGQAATEDDSALP
jgi:hypothetical protein